jgi:hypothetical protein
MSIRSELELKLAAWASSQVPPIPVAYEGVAFTKPTTGPWLQPTMLTSSTVNPTVEATRRRERGVFQINCYVRDGLGSAAVENLSNNIVNLYPVVPKTGTVSIEQTPQTAAAIVTQDGWRYIPVRVSYRQES